MEFVSGRCWECHISEGFIVACCDVTNDDFIKVIFNVGKYDSPQDEITMYEIKVEPDPTIENDLNELSYTCHELIK